MLYLATGSPDATHADDRVTVTVPNGDSTVSVSLSINQAIMLYRRTQQTVHAVLECQPEIQSAEIVPFAKRAQL